MGPSQSIPPLAFITNILIRHYFIVTLFIVGANAPGGPVVLCEHDLSVLLLQFIGEQLFIAGIIVSVVITTHRFY